MKHYILLLLMVSATLFTQAQKNGRSYNPDDRYHYRHDRYHDDLDNRRDHPRKKMRQGTSLRQQLARIDRRYDQKIHAVRTHPFMRPVVKARKIRTLEHQRRIALNECRNGYLGRPNRRYS